MYIGGDDGGEVARDARNRGCADVLAVHTGGGADGNPLQVSLNDLRLYTNIMVDEHLAQPLYMTLHPPPLPCFTRLT